MWLIVFTVVSHVDDMVHHLLVLLVALLEETAYLRQCCFAVLLAGLTLSEIVAGLCSVNLFWLIGHRASPRARHFSSLGYYCAKPMRKTVQHKENLAKATNLKDLKVFKETQMIFHGEEVLNINLTCEKQTRDTALRMRVHILTCY